MIPGSVEEAMLPPQIEPFLPFSQMPPKCVTTSSSASSPQSSPASSYHVDQQSNDKHLRAGAQIDDQVHFCVKLRPRDQ